MKILALETTERIGSVAALCDGNLLLQLELDARERSAQSLIPGIKRLLELADWRPGDVDLAAVTTGPGSFTGLRVGVTAAKFFAYAAEADILGIDTLEAIAAGVPAEVSALSVAIDAQRGDVVAATFRRASDGWFASVEDASLRSAEAWLRGLRLGSAVSGPALRKLADRVPPGVAVLDPRYWSPMAASVGHLAARDYARGRRESLWSVLPRYCRPSAAEEKWAKKGEDER